MVGAAIGAVVAGVGMYMGGEAQKDAAQTQADTAERAAKQQAEQQKALANQQAEQAKQLQAQQQAFELERKAQMEAAQKQLAADTALSAQNQRASDLTPTVQIAADVGGDSGAAKARERRAQFRREYESGVSI